MVHDSSNSIQAGTLSLIQKAAKKGWMKKWPHGWKNSSCGPQKRAQLKGIGRAYGLRQIPLHWVFFWRVCLVLLYHQYFKINIFTIFNTSYDSMKMIFYAFVKWWCVTPNSNDEKKRYTKHSSETCCAWSNNITRWRTYKSIHAQLCWYTPEFPSTPFPKRIDFLKRNYTVLHCCVFGWLGHCH